MFYRPVMRESWGQHLHRSYRDDVYHDLTWLSFRGCDFCLKIFVSHVYNIHLLRFSVPVNGSKFCYVTRAFY
uniref:Uncharacterized protein n=1 Tax=Arundo donax TaxID=35708 RepID=A0A0A9A490_ARUDO